MVKTNQADRHDRGQGSGGPEDAPPPIVEEVSPAPEAGAGGVNPEPRAPAAAGGAPAEPDYHDRWLRAEAEFQNYRRRAQRESDERARSAEERVMLEMILALDDLERALAAAREAGAPESWVGGVQLVVNRMGESLARHGVTAIDPLGERFDPAFHEAMLEVDSADVEPGHVVQVVVRGHRRGSRVLRPARVVVARRPAGSE